MGATGAVTKIDRSGRQTRIAEGLASMANTPGNDSAIGPHGIIVQGRDKVLITNGGPTDPLDTATKKPILRDTLAAKNPVANLFGKVLLIDPHGSAVPLADIWDFERRVNPDAETGNAAIDSNPVDLLLDGSRLVVADAGGNAIDTVDPWSDVSNLTVFANRLVADPADPQAPEIPMQAVPTSIEEGPDGQYYVGQLTGFPFPVGGANVYRVNPRTGEQTVVARASRTSWTWPSGATAPSTCSRSTTTVCSRPGTKARCSRSRVAARSSGSSCRPARCRNPAAWRSATTASTSRSTRARQAAGRCCASATATTEPCSGRARERPAGGSHQTLAVTPSSWRRASPRRAARRSSASRCRARSPASRAWA